MAKRFDKVKNFIKHPIATTKKAWNEASEETKDGIKTAAGITAFIAVHAMYVHEGYKKGQADSAKKIKTLTHERDIAYAKGYVAGTCNTYEDLNEMYHFEDTNKDEALKSNIEIEITEF